MCECAKLVIMQRTAGSDSARVSVRVSIQVRKHAELSRSLPGKGGGISQETSAFQHELAFEWTPSGARGRGFNSLRAHLRTVMLSEGGCRGPRLNERSTNTIRPYLPDQHRAQ